MGNKENRKAVLKYLRDEDTSDLIFSTSYDKMVTPKIANKERLSKLSVEGIIIECLKLTVPFCSWNEKKKFETLNCCFRSSLDIWRHAKYYNKDITIFDVMHTLYKYRNKIHGQYCGEVQRNVFISTEALIKYEELDAAVDDFELDITYNIDDYIHGGLEDEYGLFFDDWEEI